MRRRFLALLILSVCAGSAPTGTSAEVAPTVLVKRVKPKRVLFRTDSPRLFAPRNPEPVRPGFTAMVVRTQSSRSTTAKAAPVAKPKFRARQPMLAPLPKPTLPPDSSVATSLHDEPRSIPRFDITFQPTSFTPYDRFLGTVRSVITRLDTREASMVTACDLVQECRRFRYITTDPYRAAPPEVTEARQAGDCKSKALWVYDHLGDPAAYYVIGKLVQPSHTSHAWVYWRNGGRWWILDPTMRSAPIAADSVSPNRYVPYYSFSRSGAFRHTATRLMVAANGIPAVTPTTAVRARSSDVQGAAAAR